MRKKLRSQHSSNAFTSPIRWYSMCLKLFIVVALAQALQPHMRFKIAASVAKGERRAAERQKAQQRHLCQRCNRPLPVQCLCSVIPDEKITTATDILILQHPTEFRRKTFSTVPIIPLVLANVQIFVGNSFDPNEVQPLRKAIDEGKKLLLLFPDEEAIDLSQPDGIQNIEQRRDKAAATGAKKICFLDSEDSRAGNLLVLIDGTWTQAARMARDSPRLLDCCQKVQFTSTQTSIYDAIRKEPKEHCLSTLEACAQMLLLLEPNSELVRQADTYLHAALQRLVDAQLQQAKHTLPRFVMRNKATEKVEQRKEVERAIFGSVSPSDVDRQRESERRRAPIPAESGVTTEPPRTVQLDDGAILRPLCSFDSDWVDSTWRFRSKKSRAMVHRQINDAKASACCLGIQDKSDQLRACILRYANGALGMLHVDPEYRHRGYATALIKEAVRNMVVHYGQNHCEAFIRDGNEASEALFTRLGWVKEGGENQKKGTGKRRAKRKWLWRPAA